MAGGYIAVWKVISPSILSPHHPSELAVVGMNGGAEQIISLNESLLSHRNLGKVEEIWYEYSVDGIDPGMGCKNGSCQNIRSIHSIASRPSQLITKVDHILA